MAIFSHYTMICLIQFNFRFKKKNYSKSQIELNKSDMYALINKIYETVASLELLLSDGFQKFRFIPKYIFKIYFYYFLKFDGCKNPLLKIDRFNGTHGT